MFGWGKKKPPEEKPALPWEPDYLVAANNVVVGFPQWLMDTLTTDKGVHVESFLAVSGALIGFAANDAALMGLGKGELVTVEAKDGSTYLYGDAINAFLAPENESVPAAWPFIAGSILRAGLPEGAVPEVGPIFQHVASTLGGPDFGTVRTPPGTSVGSKVQDFLPAWMQARPMLERPGIPGRPESALPMLYWPAVLGLVAQENIMLTKDAASPASSASIVMEAAVIASKIDRRIGAA